MSNLRKKLADRWDDVEKNAKEITKYLKDTGWQEENIALWINSNYPDIKFIDTNTYTTSIFVKEMNKKEIEKIDTSDAMIYSNDEIWVSTLKGLEAVLNLY